MYIFAGNNNCWEECAVKQMEFEKNYYKKCINTKIKLQGRCTMFHKLTHNVYYSDHEEKTDRPAIGYVMGEKYSLMIESGNSPSNVKDFFHSLDTNNLKRPDFVAVTHSHWDHSFGISYIDAISIACNKTNKILRDMSSWKWTQELFSKYVSDGKIPLFCEPHINMEYPDLSEIHVRVADLSFKDEITIDLGNQLCILKNVVSPHTDDSVIVYIPNEKVVFLGDSIYEELVGNEWISHSDKLSELISELENLDFNIAVEGHFAPKTKEVLISSLKEKL
mgnify:CR=1 FL=1